MTIAKLMHTIPEFTVYYLKNIMDFQSDTNSFTWFSTPITVTRKMIASIKETSCGMMHLHEYQSWCRI